MKLTEAQKWATNNGVTLKVEYVTASGKTEDTVLEQDMPESKRIDLIPNATVTVKVVKNNQQTPTSTQVDCLKETTNSICTIPSFVGRSKSNVNAWKDSISNKITIEYVEDEESTEIKGLILKQSVEKGTSVKDILEKHNGKVTITISAGKKENGSGNDNPSNPGGETPGGETPGGDTPGGETPGGNNQGGGNEGTGDQGGTTEPEQPKPEEENNG